MSKKKVIERRQKTVAEGIRALLWKRMKAWERTMPNGVPEYWKKAYWACADAHLYLDDALANYGPQKTVAPRVEES